ncbi:Cullin-4A [Boothiomyces sp. JEL0866]|nr:Cullin-4A [Boothiomyces sp. JEL0866]
MAAHSTLVHTTHTTTTAIVTTTTTSATTTTTALPTSTAAAANAVATATQAADSTQQSSSIPVLPIILVILALVAAVCGYLFYRKKRQIVPEQSNIKEISQPIDLPEIKDIQFSADDFRVSQLLKVVDGKIKVDDGQKKIYVGYTNRTVGERVLEHFNSNGSKWTTLYRPIQVLQMREGGIKEVNELTLQMMETYGWWNVRGGSWCKVEMTNCPPALLKRQQVEMPTKLKKVHAEKAVVDSPTLTKSKSIDSTQDLAKALGSISLKDPYESPNQTRKKYADKACFICGRTSHFAKDCYAKTDIDGNPLVK